MASKFCSATGSNSDLGHHFFSVGDTNVSMIAALIIPLSGNSQKSSKMTHMKRTASVEVTDARGLYMKYEGFVGAQNETEEPVRDQDTHPFSLSGSLSPWGSHHRFSL